ncbi:hypothetical protein BC349_03325 [Flavihumibacter stibioxidans]|uniref:Peptidase M43 pregnancy-associated plasma-A domain-containing protein n=2 Tax=Flavihumibacter stibioxidans TaxID=1834163 RepID=A0ABR7M5I5_9BACT|nr:hypothetical protein [Flavihumibacter stibioxidans]
MLTVPVLLYSQKECSQSLYTQESSTNNFNIPYINAVRPVASVVSATMIKVPDVIVIPVVVHLINGEKLGITNDQVFSQIDALNRDFNGKNADLANVPERFLQLVAKTSIRFELARVDPSGKASNGIVRKESSLESFRMDDRIKFSSKGGDDAWPRDHYLNIWVGSLVNGIQGYSSLPGAPAELDGIVLSHTVFGTINKGLRFNMGRIAVHEVGHWLGLKHIWGDDYCGDDGIDDTPKQKSYNRGCPSGIITSCGTDTNGDMYMNFMDLTDDACMFMFTRGQMKKMRAAFEQGGARNALLVSGGLNNPGAAIDPDWNKPVGTTVGVDIARVYPIPSTTEVRVELEAAAAGMVKSLKVYNMMGQLVMTVPVNGRLVVMNISTFQTGQFLIKTDQPASKAVKFVKL